MNNTLTNPENVTSSAARRYAITANASPRPWRVEYDDNSDNNKIYDANGGHVVWYYDWEGAVSSADAALIVEAVNAYGEDAEYIQHLKELLAASNAERDRLRDIVRRIVDEMHYCHRDLDGEMSQRLIDLVYEARAAIGEGQREQRRERSNQ